MFTWYPSIVSLVAMLWSVVLSELAVAFIDSVVESGVVADAELLLLQLVPLLVAAAAAAVVAAAGVAAAAVPLLADEEVSDPLVAAESALPSVDPLKDYQHFTFFHL